MNESKVFEYVQQTVDGNALDHILETGRPSGVTAQDIEREFHIYRANASAMLNQLVRKQKLIKIDSRPVYFLPAELLLDRLGDSIRYAYTLDELIKALTVISPEEKKESDDPFSVLIGYDGSLARQIDQAKAAILYPPKGLHTLLIGESGTGKTLFAHAMYNYGLDRLGKDKKKFPFVEFNCSDYYHNPQLLMSHLFGHAKGAFTGATRDQEGLVEKADGGILFLDEIHRLPPEGQELLFYLMDTGSYRRLGESGNMRHAQVLIIGATTEAPRKVLLKTFMRRIPLTIELPAYRDKSVIERIQIIEHIFMRESITTQKSYIVSSQVIKALSAYHFPENIGQLSSEIQVLCARSFLNNAHERDELLVSYRNLSSPVREYYESKGQQALEKSFPSRHESDIMVAPHRPVAPYNCARLFADNLPGLVKALDSSASGGAEHGKDALDSGVQAYYDRILDHFYNENLHKGELYKVVGQEIVDFTVDVAQEVFPRLQLEITKKNVLVLAFHFKFLLERLCASKEVSPTEISDLEQGSQEEIAASEEIVSRLEGTFQISVPWEEKYLIAILLANIGRSAKGRPGLIIVAHGTSTASSMANVCNRLMDCNLVRAVDAPLEQSVQATYQQVLQEIRFVDNSKGAILLVDMGSLVTFGERLSQETGTQVYSIPNVTTLMVLDLAHVLLGTDQNAEEIYNGYILRNTLSGPKPSAQSKPEAILTMCASGAGTSVAFKTMLDEELSRNNITNVAVLAISFQDIQDNSPLYQTIQEQYQLLACVGNVECPMEIPFFHISKLISSEDKASFFRFVQQVSNSAPVLPSPAAELTVQEECRQFLSKSVMYLNPDIAVLYADRFLDAVNLEKVNSNRAMRLSLLLHLGFMLERTVLQKSIVFDNEEAFLMEHHALYTILREHVSILEEAFGVTINDAELCYIIQTITQYGSEH